MLDSKPTGTEARSWRGWFFASRKRRRERNLEEGVQRDRLLQEDYHCFPQQGKGLLGVHEPDDLPEDL